MINKKLIVLALQAYRKLITETSDISDHDETLDTIIKLNAQIKVIKEWKKQIKCSINGYIIVL